MKRNKTQKGITLIALIITIIVLLILAVVAIRAVTGDGIIAHAKNARDNSVEAQDKETILLALNEWKIVSATGNQTFENFMKGKFGADKVTAGENADEVIVTLENGNQYKVKTDGIIEANKGLSISETSVTLALDTAKYKTAELTATPNGITGEINWSIPSADASKVTLSGPTGNKITVTGEAVGETTITVSCGSYSKECKVKVIEKLDHSEVVVPTIAATGVFANNANIKEVREGNIPIPTGFTYVKGDHIGGAVITDHINETTGESEGNEFVWVPTTADVKAYGLNAPYSREPDVVTGIYPSDPGGSAVWTQYDAVASNLTRAGCTKNLVDNEGEEAGTINAYDFKVQLTNEFNEMAASVNKYDGFYVGRYEMSYEGSAKSVKGATSVTNSTEENNWYGLYAKAKTYTNSGHAVVCGMIYGCQYDAMMTWMSGNGINVNSSTPTDLSIGATSKNTSRITGAEGSKDKLSNIYDLLGNSYEWTQLAYNIIYRGYRGGYYRERSYPTDSYNDTPTTVTGDGKHGSRLTLYVM